MLPPANGGFPACPPNMAGDPVLLPPNDDGTPKGVEKPVGCEESDDEAPVGWGGRVDARKGFGVPLTPGEVAGGSESASEAPKDEVGLKGLTRLPPKPVACCCSGAGEVPLRLAPNVDDGTKGAGDEAEGAEKEDEKGRPGPDGFGEAGELPLLPRANDVAMLPMRPPSRAVDCLCGGAADGDGAGAAVVALRCAS
jgi:hypothetical protein